MDDALLGLPKANWLPVALTFNFDPGAFVHPSWIGTIPHGDLAKRLRAEPAAAADASRYLREALALEGRYCEDFAAPRSRLALLDGDTLAELSLLLGLVLRSHQLQREIRGERLRAIRQAIGIGPFSSALKWAPFLGSIPEFSYEPDTAEPKLYFTLIGLSFCVHQVADLSAGLRRRMMLKLPYDWQSAFDTHHTWTKPQDSAPDDGLAPIVQKLIKELLPKWHPLFA